MEPQIRLIHWYDTERHAIACGAPGQSNSTKHIRGVTCSACLAVEGRTHGVMHAGEDGASYIN